MCACTLAMRCGWCVEAESWQYPPLRGNHGEEARGSADPRHARREHACSPSPALVEDTLAELGAPNPTETARVLSKAGISLVPVEKPKRSRVSENRIAASSLSIKTISDPPPIPVSPPDRFWSKAGMRRYGKDCTYSLAVRWGGNLLGWLVIVAISMFTFIQFDLIDRLPDARTIYSREAKKDQTSKLPASEPSAELVPTELEPDTSSITTGSIEPPPLPTPISTPWHVETTIYKEPEAEKDAPKRPRMQPAGTPTAYRSPHQRQ